MKPDLEKSDGIPLTKQLKLIYWGEGPWVEEPDYRRFEHKGFECLMRRVCGLDGPRSSHLFGGHWCGYVKLPNNHPWIASDNVEIKIDVHGGITFNQKDDHGDHWMGFDCAHSGDIVPSMIEIMCKAKEDLAKEFPHLAHIQSAVFKDVYKDFEYVMNEVKSLAEQAKKAMKHAN